MKCPYCYGTGKSEMKKCRLCGRRYANWGSRICEGCFRLQDEMMKNPIAVVRKVMSEIEKKPKESK